MASSIYKWLFLPLLALVLTSAKAPALHPFHVSVVEIEHNAEDKSLEISCKIFTDDFEKMLGQFGKTKVDLINPPDRKVVDKLIADYLAINLQLKAEGKSLNFSYLGYEREDDAIHAYVEVTNVPTLKKLDLTNRIMYDLFDDQTNLVHVKVGGNRKSSKLEFPAKELSFSF